MAKRIYFATIIKWWKSIAATSTILGAALFAYLVFSGAIEINDHSGDVACDGTQEDPCYAYVNFTVKEDIFLYQVGYDPYGRDTIFDFSPQVKSWIMERSWGTGWREINLSRSCQGTWCGLSNSKDERKFSYAFREGRDYQIRLVIEKYHPSNTIKWSINHEDKEYLDPIFIGIGNLTLDPYNIDNWEEFSDIFFSYTGEHPNIQLKENKQSPLRPSQKYKIKKDKKNNDISIEFKNITNANYTDIRFKIYIPETCNETKNYISNQSGHLIEDYNEWECGNVKEFDIEEMESMVESGNYFINDFLEIEPSIRWLECPEENRVYNPPGVQPEWTCKQIVDVVLTYAGREYGMWAQWEMKDGSWSGTFYGTEISGANIILSDAGGGPANYSSTLKNINQIFSLPLDDGDGTTTVINIADSGYPSGTALANDQPNSITGQIGNAVNFDEGDYFDIGTSSDWNAGGFANEHSVAFWFKRGHTTASHNNIFDLDGRYGFVANGSSWGIADQAAINWYDGAEEERIWFDAPYGQWIFVVFTKNNTGNYLFIDGVFNSSIIDSDDVAFIGGGARWGCNRAGGSCMSGGLDEINVWNRTLTPTEILNANESIAVPGSFLSDGFWPTPGTSYNWKIFEEVGWDACEFRSSDDNSTWGAFDTATHEADLGVDNKEAGQWNCSLATASDEGEHVNVSYILPLDIFIKSPLNQTYYNGTYDLNVTSTGATVESWFYTNDSGATNITFTPNLTFFNVPNGEYLLSIYANTSGGTEKKKDVAFTFNQTWQENILKSYEVIRIDTVCSGPIATPGIDDIVYDSSTYCRNSGNGSFNCRSSGLGTSPTYDVNGTCPDINNNDKLDIGYGTFDEREIRVANNTGHEDFTLQIIKGYEFSGTHREPIFSFLDVELDGYPDMIVRGNDSVSLDLFCNDGDETFTEFTGINTEVTEIGTSQVDQKTHQFEGADMDGDGDTDIVGVTKEVGLYMLMNNGSNCSNNDWNFANVTGTINPRYSYVWLEDIDGDGDIDIIAGSDNGTDGNVEWFENDGTGNFTAYVIGYTDSNSGVWSVIAYDVDVDGDMDIVAGVGGGLGTGHFNDTSRLAWFENDGSENFHQRPIAGRYTDFKWYVNDLAVGDFNDDGRTDFLAIMTDSSRSQLLYYNFTTGNTPPSAGTFNAPPNNTVAAFITQFNWTNAEADVDGDIINYNLRVDNDSDFSSPEYNNWTIAETPTITGDTPILNEGTHYWKVRTCDTYGCGNWSEINIFSYDATTPPEINFILQDFPDIDFFNAMGRNINATYSITDETGLNVSRITMHQKINSSVRAGSGIFINGTEVGNGSFVSGFASVSNVSDQFNFTFDNNMIYPASYNFLQVDMEDEVPLNRELQNNNQFWSTELNNLNQSKNISFLEIMVNASNSAVCDVNYCNSSFAFNGNPRTDSNCIGFANIEGANPFNHSHGDDSQIKDVVLTFPLNATSGLVSGNIQLTENNSDFIVGKISGVGSCYVHYIQNESRTDVVQLSTNKGNAWTTQTVTTIMHLHQYDGTDALYYFPEACDVIGAGNCINDSIRTDLIDVGGLPPSPPDVFNPENENVSGLININWTAAFSPNNYEITRYNITLLNESLDVNQSIANISGLEMSYLWHSNETINADYFIEIEACDSIEQCVSGFSELFAINNSVPIWKLNSSNPDEPIDFSTDMFFSITYEDGEPDSIDFQWERGEGIVNETIGVHGYGSGSNITFNLTTDYLPGNYTFYWIGNNTDGIQNRTDNYEYEITKGPGVINLTLDGLEGNRKYEYKSTSNITASGNSEICLSINVPNIGVNFSCGLIPNISYLVSEIRTSNFTNSTGNHTTENLTFGNSPQHVNISLNQNATVQELNFNISGHPFNSDYPENLIIDILDDGILDLSIPGNLTGNVNHISYFSNNLDSEELVFITPGGIQRFFNVSRYWLDPFVDIMNGTINLTGGVSNPDNISYTNPLWNNTDSLTDLTNSSNVQWVRENFNLGDIGRWSGSYAITTGSDITTRSDCECAPTGDCDITNTQTDSDNSFSTDFNLARFGSTFISVRTDAAGSSDRNPCIDVSGGQGIARFGIKDKTSGIKTIIISTVGGDSGVGSPISGSAGDSSIIELRKINNKIEFYDDGIKVGDINYDPIHEYEVYSDTQCNCFVQDFFNPNQRARGSASVELYEINHTGITGNMTANNTFSNGTWTSGEIKSFDGNITTAIFNWTEIKPAGTEVEGFLSADNGTNWESITKEILHVFNIPGNNLSFGFFVTGTNTQDSNGDLSEQAIVTDIDLKVTQGFPINLSIDIGADGILEWNNTGDDELDNTESIVANFSGISIRNYLQDNCLTGFDCLVPILFSTDAAGSLLVNYLDVNSTIRNIKLDNATLMSDMSNSIVGNSVNVSISSIDGILELKDLDLRYIGEEDVIVYANIFDNENVTAIESTKVITIRRSLFNITLPSNLESWEIIPKSLTQFNVTPYKQYINATSLLGSIPIFNISNLATFDPFDMYIRLNESIHSCVNMTLANSVDKNEGFALNTSDQRYITNLSTSNSTGINMWVDLACSAVSLRYFNPQIIFNTVCSECVYPTLSD